MRVTAQDFAAIAAQSPIRTFAIEACDNRMAAIEQLRNALGLTAVFSVGRDPVFVPRNELSDDEFVTLVVSSAVERTVVIDLSLGDSTRANALFMAIRDEKIIGTVVFVYQRDYDSSRLPIPDMVFNRMLHMSLLGAE